MTVRKVYQSTPSGKQPTSNVNHHRQAKVKKSPKGKTILVILALAGISGVSAVVGAILAVAFSSAPPLQQAELTSEEKKVFSQEETVSAQTLKIPELSRPVNILVLGIKVLTSDVKDKSKLIEHKDAGYHALVNSFEGLSDTMLLLRFDPETEKLSVLSIPRDTRVHIDGYGVRKINRANEYGGPALSASVASELLGGINIDRYVRVNVQGVEKLIDALGGVTVDVPKDMKYNDFSQHLYIDLKKGKQHLNGDKAVQFLRFRYDAYGDISRVQRQQMFMRALVEQTLKPATIVRVPKILSVIQSNIDTNLTVKELMALGGFAAKTQRSDVKLMMLPGNFSGNGRHEISYWLPSKSSINRLMTKHFNLPAYGDNLELATERSGTFSEENLSEKKLSKRQLARTSGMRIYVEDTTGDQLALQTALDTLRQAGYKRVYASKNWQKPLKETRFIAQSGDDDAASVARDVLGVGEILVESTGVLDSDLTIQLGKDWHKQVYPPSQVNIEEKINDL